MIGKEILNYRITAFIGKGGMGSVYLAEHKYITTQKVAIKVINKEMLNSFTVGLLKSEAEHLASLNHPNIVHFIDYHVDEEGNVYLVMEYAPGISLDKYVKTVTGLIVEDRIAPIFEPILDAVEYAHSKHLLHRDIKPQNIIIGEDGTPKILDFGISQILHGDDDNNEDDFAAGTPSYMSPEQVRNERLDERSDVYSLGVMLHQLLTGVAPYDTTTLSEQEIEQLIVSEPLPPMRSYYKYISDRIQKVVDKATAKDKEKRYRSCADFKRAFHNAIFPPKIPMWAKIAIGVAATVIVAVAGYIWDYNRVKVEYYGGYTEVYGVPQGFDKLSKGDMEHRYRTYKFTYTKHRLIEMAIVNCKGNLEDPNSESINQFTLQRYFYDGNGKVDYVKICDRNEKVLYVMDYNPELTTATFKYNDSIGTERNLSGSAVDLAGINTAWDEGKSRISRYIYTRDSEGRVTKVEYAAFQNQRVCDRDGIWGLGYVYDEKGHVSEIHYLGYDGNIKGLKNGLAIRVSVYDGDRVVEERYLTSERKGAGEGEAGVPVCRYTLDKYGNIVRQEHFTLDGKPMNTKNDHIARYDAEIENGFRTKLTFYDVEGKPMTCNYNFAGLKFKYNEYGYVSEHFGIDESGNRCNTAQGYSGIKYITDPKGNNLEITYCDENGNPTFYPEEGYSTMKMEYDNRGNTTSYSYFDAEGKPIINKNGFARIAIEYDKYDRLSKREYFDAEGKHYGGENGIEYEKFEYDLAGNLTKVSYFDSTGKDLKVCNEGNCGWTAKYNEFGLETERVFFGKNGSPVRVTSGYASYQMKYDERGNNTSLRYYDESGSICYGYYNGVKCCGFNAKYDERGNMVFYSVVGTDGNLLTGYLSAKYKYDDNDNETEISYWNGNSKGLNSWNIHRISRTFNDRNQVTEEKYYGKTDDLVINTNIGAAIKRSKYDNSGNETETTFYNTNNNPTNGKDGYYKLVQEYDVMNRCTRELYYLASGSLVSASSLPPEVKYQYDKWGNVSEIAYCDGNGKPITHPISKCAYIRYKYDGGNMLESACFDVNNNPVINAYNYHKEVHTYNKRHQLSVMAVYDTAGKPIDCAAGFQKVVIYFDRENRMAYRRYFSASGRTVATEKNNGGNWELYSGSIPSDCTADDSAPDTTTVDGTPSATTPEPEKPKKEETKPSNSGTTSSSSSSSSVSSSAVASIKSQLPKHISTEGGTVRMTAISVKGNTVSVVFRTPNSMYDTSDNELNDIKAKVRAELRSIKSRTGASKVVGNILDSKDRSITTVTI